MGKNKRLKLSSSHTKTKGFSKPVPKSKSVVNGQKSTPQSASTKSQSKTQKQHLAPTIPFVPENRILLIGEGDLSFARSLIECHGCKNITATVLESSTEELVAKYPQAEENISVIEKGGGSVKYGVDAGKMGPFMDKKGKGGKGEGKMDRIIFNFPHVGGKSTDVNRQVRYNQELLVSFFKRALPSLAPGGSIIVTLFEGEPYTLWNIRDLARHAGLQVERSFRFQAKAYLGYKHARTLGAVKGGGGWKGEERESRSFVFVREWESQQAQGMGKRKRHESNGDSDDED